YTFKLTIRQGLNRQIRRMCTALGYEVRALQRVRIMNILLGDLAVGEWRDLTDAERTELFAELDYTPKR
nr:23S rRNA pseudouridine synthase F [Planococcus sp. (in: firmicutes)]